MVGDEMRVFSGLMLSPLNTGSMSALESYHPLKDERAKSETVIAQIFRNHSHRNETTGSTAAARRAGSHAESTVTAVMPAAAAMKIVGSKGLMR
jgi:hypothetical protein